MSIHMTQKSIVKHIKKINLFQSLSDDCLLALASKLEVIFVKGQEQLFSKGDVDNDMYILVRGRLIYHCRDTNGRDLVIRELAAGSFIGEVSMIAEVPRAVDTYTLRDSLMLRLTRANFLEVVKVHPDLFSVLSQHAIRFLASVTGNNKNNIENKVITLVPIIKDTNVLSVLMQKLRGYAHDQDWLIVTSDDRPPKSSLTDYFFWLTQQEEKFKHLIYIADYELTEWSQACVRECDSVFLLTLADSDSFLLSPVECYLKNRQKTKCIYKFEELLILHTKHITLPTNTPQWLSNRSVGQHFHIQTYSQRGFDRFIRVITHQTNALVLSAGGPRGLAHLGLLRHLEENNVDFDFVAGCSMGSFIGSIVARQLSWSEQIEKINNVLIQGAKMNYTYPFLSLSTGKSLVKALLELTPSDILIENLWLNFFCVSTDIVSNNLYVHDKGSLWKSLRCSISLPFLYPPVYFQETLHVDGGLLNTLPVDIMKDFSRGSLTLASNVCFSKDSVVPLPEVVSGWTLLMDSKKYSQWSLLNLVGKLLTISSSKHLEKMLEMADLNCSMQVESNDIKNFSKSQTIIEEGYNQAKKILTPDLLSPFTCSFRKRQV